MSNASRSLNLFFSKNTFKGSFNSFTDVPNEYLPECCFVGRSNVGKSSIINAITKSKKLAKTSKTPGRTQNINLFLINEKINVIDLPGYGYAKISKIKREELATLVENYLINRAANFINKQKESLLSLLKNYKLNFNTIFSSSSSKNLGIVDIQKEIFNLTKMS